MGMLATSALTFAAVAVTACTSAEAGVSALPARNPPLRKIATTETIHLRDHGARPNVAENSRPAFAKIDDLLARANGPSRS